MLIGEDGLLPLETGRGIDIAGFNDNWWLGLSLLHTLFVKEHNYVCDQLKKLYMLIGTTTDSTTRPA